MSAGVCYCCMSVISKVGFKIQDALFSEPSVVLIGKLLFSGRICLLFSTHD